MVKVEIDLFAFIFYADYSVFKNFFMLSVRISSYGCTRKFGEHERCVRFARGDSRVQL